MAKFVSFLKPPSLQLLTWPHSQPLFSREKFFLSFGDSLVFLFKHYGFQGQQEVALLPNFYCPETLKFISQYFKIVFYKINNDFSVDKESYFQKIQENKPRLIINYSFIGFSLNVEEQTRLQNLISEDAVIIEDYAHRLLDFDEWQPLNKNHFIIDSVRKHSTILGSHLVNQNFRSSLKAEHCNFYKLKCQLFQVARDFIGFFAVLFNSCRLYNLSEKIFLLQDEIVGVYSKPTYGGWSSYCLYSFLNLKKLKKHRQELALEYTKNLKVLNNSRIKFLEESVLLGGELNHYPLFVPVEMQEDLLLFLEQEQIFADHLWEVEDLFLNQLNLELYNSFIILPLTWQITSKDVVRIVKTIEGFLNSK